MGPARMDESVYSPKTLNVSGIVYTRAETEADMVDTRKRGRITRFSICLLNTGPSPRIPARER